MHRAGRPAWRDRPRSSGTPASAAAARSSTRAIGERTVVWASVVEASVIEHDVTVGPFAHVRAGAHIEPGVQLGNYAEVKNSRVGAGSKSHHFSYLGDADVGAGVNIGAGTITANFDGQRKHRTTIGDAAFIGSDTILRAPVEIGAGAYTGAGSVVTRDVPPGMIAVGVPARIRRRHASASPRPSRHRPGPQWRASWSTDGRQPPRAPHHRPAHRRERGVRGGRDRAHHGPAQPPARSSATRATGSADRVRRLVERPGALLATIQLGITFVGFLAAAFAGASIADSLADALATVGRSRARLTSSRCSS